MRTRSSRRRGNPLYSRWRSEDIPSIIVRRLPYDDPGTPDLRSPARFLLWTGEAAVAHPAGRHRSSASIWMVAQALVPAAIGRGLQTRASPTATWARPAAGRSSCSAWPWCRRCSACCGTGWRSTNWLCASLPRHAAARPAQRPGRASPSAASCPPARWCRPRPTTPCTIGGAFDVSARLAGAIVSYVRRRGAPAERPRCCSGPSCCSASRRWCCCSGRCCARCSAGRRVQREVAGKLTALGADTVAGLRVLRGIGGEPAFLARYRLRSAELRDAGVHVANPQATLDSAQVLLPGIFLVVVTWLSARLAIEGNRRRRRHRRVLRLRVLPRRADPHRGRGGRQAHPVAGRCPPHRGVLETRPEISEPEQPAAEPPYRVALADPHVRAARRARPLVGPGQRGPRRLGRGRHRLGRLTDRRRRHRSAAYPLADLPLRDRTPAGARVRGGAAAVHRRPAGELDPWGARPATTPPCSTALDVAAAGDVLEALPEGLDAQVDEAGRGFSGGQRQRLALARALLADSRRPRAGRADQRRRRAHRGARRRAAAGVPARRRPPRPRRPRS